MLEVFKTSPELLGSFNSKKRIKLVLNQEQIVFFVILRRKTI